MITSKRLAEIERKWNRYIHLVNFPLPEHPGEDVRDLLIALREAQLAATPLPVEHYTGTIIALMRERDVLHRRVETLEAERQAMRELSKPLRGEGAR